MIINGFDYARITQYVENYQDYIQNYRLLQNPIKCIYYLVDTQNSMVNFTLAGGGYYEMTGEKSPLKFIRIYNYPLGYVSNPIQAETNQKDYGIYFDPRPEVLLPTINFIPTLYDMIVLDYYVNQPYNPESVLYIFDNISHMYTYKDIYLIYKLKLKPYNPQKTVLPNQITQEYFYDEFSKKLFTLEQYQQLLDLRLKIGTIDEDIYKESIKNYLTSYNLWDFNYTYDAINFAPIPDPSQPPDISM